MEHVQSVRASKGDGSQQTNEHANKHTNKPRAHTKTSKGTMGTTPDVEEYCKPRPRTCKPTGEQSRKRIDPPTNTQTPQRTHTNKQPQTHAFHLQIKIRQCHDCVDGYLGGWPEEVAGGEGLVETKA